MTSFKAQILTSIFPQIDNTHFNYTQSATYLKYNNKNQMFELEPKKSSRTSNTNKPQSSSRHKMSKKQTPNQRIMLELVKTEGNKDKKNKSQCFSKDHVGERKSIDVSKFIQTTRSIPSKRMKQRPEREKSIKHEALFTEAPRQSYMGSNLTTQKSTELKWHRKGSLKKHTQGRSVEKKKLPWNQKLVPFDWPTVVEKYGHLLSKHEQSEIMDYKKVYYVGHRAAKREKTDGSGWQYDNEDKEYRFVENDHIAYRYQILSQIGKGSYGQVFKVFDHKVKEEVALKMIKNDPKFSKQAFVEIKILSHIKQQDQQQQSNVVRIRDFVVFRKHVCIIFELLSQNLYQLIIRNNYNGLSEQLIRRFAIQILVSLQFLRNQRVIHCDLKPQNILLKQYNKSGIKIIDFGSSCFQKETVYTYIQSRYYRAPQITLGVPYSHCIDIWSTGCILSELYTGVPVFPGQNQYQQMKYMTDSLGQPPKAFLLRGNRRNVFFQDSGKLRNQINELKTTIDMFSKPLQERIEDVDFLSFINCFLKWAPEERISPIDALNHPWISKGLPEELKNKLSVGSAKLIKTKLVSSTKRIKTKSREKGSSVSKLTNRGSQQKITKRYCIKF